MVWYCNVQLPSKIPKHFGFIFLASMHVNPYRNNLMKQTNPRTYSPQRCFDVGHLSLRCGCGFIHDGSLTVCLVLWQTKNRDTLSRLFEETKKTRARGNYIHHWLLSAPRASSSSPSHFPPAKDGRSVCLYWFSCSLFFCLSVSVFIERRYLPAAVHSISCCCWMCPCQQFHTYMDTYTPRSGWRTSGQPVWVRNTQSLVPYSITVLMIRELLSQAALHRLLSRYTRSLHALKFKVPIESRVDYQVRGMPRFEKVMVSL